MVGSSSSNLHLQDTIEVWKREIFIGKYTLKINSESKDRLLLITEVATDEKHLLHCQSEGGTMVYEIPFPLKPASDYVVQAFYGSCLRPGKYSLCAHAHFEFRTGNILNTFSDLLILKMFEC